MDFVPSLSSALVAVAVAFMVHRLTRKREKDKSVFELHRSLVDNVKEVREAATKVGPRNQRRDAKQPSKRRGGSSKELAF